MNIRDDGVTCWLKMIPLRFCVSATSLFRRRLAPAAGHAHNALSLPAKSNSMTEHNRPASGFWAQLAEWWQTLRDYLGAGGRRREPVIDRASLRRFLEQCASHVAQTSLYGYLRTRAGQRYPELFEDDGFIVSLNIAKWHVWLDCLGDLAVYSGALMARQRPADVTRIAHLMGELVHDILRDTGIPAEAGERFAAHAEQVRERVVRCEWAQVGEAEAAFTASPAALVEWAPIIDTLKELDADIVMNSVRFRWQEVRRDLRALLDTDAVLREAP